MSKQSKLTGEDNYFEVPSTFNRVRADKVLHHHCPELSRSQIQRFFESGLVWLDNEVIIKSQRLSAGDTIYYTLPATQPVDLKPIALPLEIIFEDEHIVAVNKIAGLVVHPGCGITEPTLVHAMLHHCRESLSGIGGVERPGIVHRLDKDTSGIIVVAKSDTAFLGLSKMFEERTLKKDYLALVSGVPTMSSGTIKEPIGRHPVNRIKMAVTLNGRFAHSDWKCQETYGGQYALLKIRIHTGRTHQIRVHLAHIGHPVLGDHLYGSKAETTTTPPIQRFLLHAHRLSLRHPITEQKLELKAPIPSDFLSILTHFREQLSG